MSEYFASTETRSARDDELAVEFGLVILEGMGVGAFNMSMLTAEHEPFGVDLTEEYKGSAIGDRDADLTSVAAQSEFTWVLKMSIDFH